MDRRQSLDAAILSLSPKNGSPTVRGDTFLAYVEGHRDARHAAAELANEADAEISRLRDTQRVLVEALEGLMEVERRGRVMPIGAAWDAARAALASVEQQQEPRTRQELHDMVAKAAGTEFYNPSLGQPQSDPAQPSDEEVTAREVGSCTYPDCECVPNGDVGCNSPNAAARGLSGGPQA